MRDADMLAFVREQLAGLGGVEARAMFGGRHISHEGVFFAILSGGRLYFKTDEATRPGYEARGMGPFRPRAGVTIRSFSEVPVEVLEDAAELAVWARRAIACQMRREEAKAPAGRGAGRGAGGKAGRKREERKGGARRGGRGRISGGDIG